ncbi:biopolymer transporter ExbD [Fulvimarina sp. 2208YS6-2-32]|uniref:Biopolymer transporter ExbD n=1 Tax=Fulvimarina uroteuthidis TaxID=3098149 RepID=A0ABU5I4H2_9HYPH|nr:biopolymer transporter ExbD [Fulvimarina sp. 2208YS6-2-32]MDY8109833.1 biopolymer transporter ExbD [Fulvimarina sp. 2208YS6-2-32]
MNLQRPVKRCGQDPTIALINIVFLMLIFFLLAGSIAAQGDGDIELIRTSEAEGTRPPAGPVAITAQGEMRYGGRTLTRDALFGVLGQTSAAPAGNRGSQNAMATAAPVSVVADRNLPAVELIAFLRAMREAGYETRIVTRSGGSL